MNGASTSAFYEDREFNLAMGAGALGSSLDDFNGDNFDHGDLNFLHGANIRFTQTGLRPIQYQPVPAGTPKWGAEFKKATIHNANRVLSVTGQGASMPNRYHMSFLISFLLPMGIAFEMPLAMTFLTRIGMLTPDKLKQVRKYAYVGLAIVGTLISPPDFVSHLSVTLPLIVLFEISAFISTRYYRRKLAMQTI